MIFLNPKFAAVFALFLFRFSSFAGELLHNGDFEQGMWRQQCPIHFFNTNANNYTVLHSHAIQDFIETLTDGIDYEFSYLFGNWYPPTVPGDIILMLLDQTAQWRYGSYFWTEPNDRWISGSEPNIHTVARDDDRAKLLAVLWNWQQTKGKYTASGREFFFTLEATESLTMAIDNASFVCKPYAPFDFVNEKRYLKNTIQWQIGKPGQLVVKPHDHWNSKTSFWKMTEVDEFGNPKGTAGKSILVTDKPRLKNQERFDPESLLPTIPPGSVRYFKLNHSVRCQDKPGTFEDHADDWIIIERELKIQADPKDILCSDPDDFISIPYDLIYETVTGLNFQAELYQDGILVETITLDASLKSGVAKFKNTHASGDYRVKFIAQSLSLFGGPLIATDEYKFKINKPKVSIQGPTSLVIGRNGQFTLDYEKPGNDPVVDWEHIDDNGIWVADPSKTIQNTIYWLNEGNYQIKARATWYPKCFADANLDIKVIEVKPIPKIAISDVPCSDPTDLKGTFTLDDQGFKILTMKAILLEQGKILETFDIADPSSRSGPINFKTTQRPNDYQIKFVITYEIIPGKNKTLETLTDFKIVLPQPWIDGPNFLYLDTDGTYRLQDVPHTPQIQWHYQDEFMLFQPGLKNTITQILKWNARGTYQVTADLVWGPYCKVSANKITRLVKEKTVYVPTGFTPEGNDLNEFFGPSGIDAYVTEFIIFNRWGEIMYKAPPGDIADFFVVPGVNNPNLKAWDGNHNGKAAPLGVYAYLLRAESYISDDSGSKKSIKRTGTITLIR